MVILYSVILPMINTALLMDNGKYERAGVIKIQYGFYKCNNTGKKNSNRPWSQFLAYVLHSTYIHSVSLCIYSDMNMCACAHSQYTLLPSLRNYNTIIHPEALTMRSVKQKILPSYAVSNKPLHFLLFFIILFYLSVFVWARVCKTITLRRLAGPHLFLPSTQPPFTKLFLGDSLFKLISFLSPTTLITLLIWGKLYGSQQCDNNEQLLLQ